MIMDWGKESEGGELHVYPEGTYKVSVNSFEKVTASTGTEQIRWKATILEPVEYVGKPITIHTALTDKSLWRVARLVKACGVDVKSLMKMEVLSPAFMQVLEACCRRTSYWHMIVTPNNKGQERNEVDDFRLDEEQEIVSIPQGDEEIPDFLKEVKE
jgi:hypothetical protein